MGCATQSNSKKIGGDKNLSFLVLIELGLMNDQWGKLFPCGPILTVFGRGSRPISIQTPERRMPTHRFNSQWQGPFPASTRSENGRKDHNSAEFQCVCSRQATDGS